MKIVVLGSNSFSGASFCKYALRQGAEVIGTSRSEQAPPAYAPYRWAIDQNPELSFRFQRLDLNHDLEALSKLLTKEQPNFVVNFAAQSMVGQSWDFPEDWFLTNAVSTTKMFNQLRKQMGDFGRYVHITTPEVYGPTEGWIKEDTPFNPTTPYAVSRAAGDMSLKSFVEAYNLPAVCTRAANVYGPGQPIYRIIPRALYFFRSGQTLELHGGGSSVRSFIHMDDVSAATWKIMSDGLIGETYHISTDQVVSIKGLVERMAQCLGVSFDDHVKIVGERLGKDAAYMLDSSKLKSTLGWQSSISLDAGLDECIRWIDTYLEDLKQLPQAYKHKK